MCVRKLQLDWYDLEHTTKKAPVTADSSVYIKNIYCSCWWSSVQARRKRVFSIEWKCVPASRRASSLSPLPAAGARLRPIV